MDEGPLSRIGYFIPTRYLPFVLYYEAAIEKKNTRYPTSGIWF